MDAAAHYRHLLQLGRDEFLAASAPAALVRHRGPGRASSDDSDTLTIDQESAEEHTADETMPHTREPAQEIEMEVYPLAKKPGASFRSEEHTSELQSLV